MSDNMSLHTDLTRRVMALEDRQGAIPTLSEFTEALHEVKEELMQPIEELHMVATNRGSEVETRLHSLGQRVSIIEKDVRGIRRQMTSLDAQLARLNTNIEAVLDRLR